MTGKASSDQSTIDKHHVPDATGEVRAVLAAISRAWQERRYEELTEFFAPNMVLVLPGFAGRLEGRESIMASYQEFMDRITLTEYREAEAAVDVLGDTAMASFRWEMTWLAGVVPNRAAGHDAFLLQRVPADDAGRTPRWIALWRTMAFESDSASSSQPAT